VDAVVHEKDAGAGVGEGEESLVVVAVDGIGIAVDDDGGGAIEDLVILRPFGDDGGLNGKVFLLVEALGEEEGAGAEFVVAGGVGGLAGEEDDFFGRVLSEGGADKAEEDEE